MLASGGNGAVLPQTNFDALKFKPETVDAFEIGAKFNGPGVDVNVAVFHETFKNFQLNTFNGLNFVVENINSCSDDLGGADTDNLPRPALARATPGRAFAARASRSSSSPGPCRTLRGIAGSPWPTPNTVTTLSAPVDGP